jgi:hypothetical protein
MIYLQRFSQTPEFIQFMGVIEAAVQDHDSPLFLHGFVVARPPEWISLRKMQREGWGTIFHDYESFAQVSGLGEEEYFTGDGDDKDLHKKWQSFSPPRRQPFLVKVCVAPTTPSSVALRRQLETICSNETRFYAVVEDRAPARLAALEGGRRMTAAAQSGTLGGFLKDQSGIIFGVTCGHVGQKKGDTTSAQDVAGATSGIGSVVETNWPLTTSTGLCQTATAPNRVDMALTDVASGQVATNHVRGIGIITAITRLAGLGSGHRVQMAGAVTGADDFDITGYVATYRTHYNGVYYCFTNVYQISGVISNFLFRSYTPIPKLGDSGAWVCCPADPTGTALCGMLFAVDSARGYVSFTDEMDTWAKSTGHALTTF